MGLLKGPLHQPSNRMQRQWGNLWPRPPSQQEGFVNLVWVKVYMLQPLCPTLPERWEGHKQWGEKSHRPPTSFQQNCKWVRHLWFPIFLETKGVGLWIEVPGNHCIFLSFIQWKQNHMPTDFTEVLWTRFPDRKNKTNKTSRNPPYPWTV